MKKLFAVILIVAVIGIFGFGFFASMPKKLATPQKWSEEAVARAVVSKVTPNGIEVRFTEGKIKDKQRFFPGERGYTNSQPVCVKCTVYYVRYYDTEGGAVEWIHRSVEPLPTKKGP